MGESNPRYHPIAATLTRTDRLGALSVLTDMQLFEFPCRFEIKAMGRWSDELEGRISSIIGRHLDGSVVLRTSSRLSQGGRYISITCLIEAQSREQVDAIYMDLNSEADVLMTL